MGQATIDGHDQVFIAMEFLAGGTLRDWIAAGPYPWREAVERLLPAARALAAAHAQGIVHRDFKPANVLCTEQGEVKVADFGLAQYADPMRTDEGMSSTDSASGVAGTPAYMAPEVRAGAKADARADQYAFCLVLQQAVDASTGAPPRVAEAIARGLDADPARRHPDMHALVRTLEATVTARRSRASLSFVAALAVVAAVVAVLAKPSPIEPCSDSASRLAGTWDDDVRARIRERVAEADDPRSDPWPWLAATLDDYAVAWTAAHAQTCRAARIEHTLGPVELDARMGCLAAGLRSLRAVTTTLADADAETLTHLGPVVGRLRPVAACLAAVDPSAVRPAPPPAHAAREVDVVRAMLAEASSQLSAGHLDVAATDVGIAWDRARRVAYPPVVAEALAVRGSVADARGDYAAASNMLRDAHELAVGNRDDALAIATSTRLIFIVGERLAQPDRAEAWVRHAEAALTRAGAHDSLEAADFHNNVGALAYTRGDDDNALTEYEHALQLRRRWLPAGDPLIAASLTNVGNAQHRLARFDAARRSHEQALAIAAKALGEGHPTVAELRVNLANALSNLGDDEANLAQLQRALADQEKVLGPDHPKIANTLGNRGLALMFLDRNDEAVPLLRRSLQIKERRIGADDPRVGTDLVNFGVILRQAGELEESVEVFRRARRILAAARGEGDVYVRAALQGEAMALQMLDRPKEALRPMAQAVAISEQRGGPDDPSAATDLDDYAMILRQLGEIDEGLKLHRDALARLERIYGEDSPELSLTLVHIAQALRARAADGDHEQARRVLARAESLTPEGSGDRAYVHVNEARLDLDEGQPRRALDRVVWAVDVCRSPGVEAHTCLALDEVRAEALCRTGARAEGRRLLQEAGTAVDGVDACR